jgi:hypothetical protein
MAQLQVEFRKSNGLPVASVTTLVEPSAPAILLMTDE